MKLFATASNAASAHNFSLLKPVKPCYGNQNGYQPIYPHLSTHKMLITLQVIHKISSWFSMGIFHYPLYFSLIVDVLWTILHDSSFIFSFFPRSATFLPYLLRSSTFIWITLPFFCKKSGKCA